ncbi:MAG: glutamine amidotransferase [Gemmatales bacterium]|nr:glutamine amidotransferase [Gemmatales bacterium]MDW7994095.1 glutamine amidotransferase [Gemmatales bacterium]
MAEFLPRLNQPWEPLTLPVVLAVCALVAVLTVWSYLGLRSAVRWMLALGMVAALVYAIAGLAGSYSARAGQLSSLGEAFREQLWTLTGCGLIIAGCLVALRMTASWRQPSATVAQPRQVAILLTLRLLTVLVLGLILLRPSWEFTTTETRTGQVIILLDESRSMQERDELPDMSRWQKAVAELQQARELIEQLQRERTVELALFTFHVAGHLRPIPAETWPKAEHNPDGGNTGLLDALVRVLQERRQASDKPVLAVILLSDGRDTYNFPRLDEVVQKAREQSTRIHAIGFGHPGGTKALPDVEVARIEAPRHVRIKDRLVVTGVVNTQQLLNQPITIRLLIDGKPAVHAEKPNQEVTYTITPERHQQTFRFALPPARSPDQPGNIRVSLRADFQPAERDLSNNEKVTTITVTKEGLSVLYLDRLRAWEPREIARAFKGDERISLFTDFNYRVTEPNSWRQKLLENLRNTQYDVFILGDIPASQFSPEILQHLADAVDKRGAGLLMIGGHQSFAAGGWHNTPLAKVLPVDMSESGSLEGGPNRILDVPFIPEPRALAEHHFILRQGPDPKTSLQRWQQLPPCSGGSKLGRPVVRAQVLATSQPDGKGEILLAVLDGIGKGRSAALAVDTTWRWTMPPFDKRLLFKPLPPGELTEGQIAFIRFWRQLVLWLARQEQQGDAIYADLEVLDLPRGSSQGVLLQAVRVQPGGHRDERLPVESVIFHLELLKPGEDTPRRLSLEARSGADGKVRVTLPRDETLQPGQYVLFVSAEHNGKPFAERISVSFLVSDISREDLNRSANFDLLQQLCARTGGIFQAHSGLTKLLEQYRTGESLVRTITERYPDWDKPMPLAQGLALLLFALLIIAEWTLRRYWGLV